MDGTAKGGRHSGDPQKDHQCMGCLRRYDLSAEEIAEWERNLDQFGIPGLYITCTNRKHSTQVSNEEIECAVPEALKLFRSGAADIARWSGKIAEVRTVTGCPLGHG